MSTYQAPLRQRSKLPTKESFEHGASHEDSANKSRRAEIVWGKTPSGEVFRVPTTHDVLTALFHPSYPKSHFDILNLILLGLHIVLFLFLPRITARYFFLVYFAFWRAAYDAGLGWMLTKQSKKRWIVREIQRFGWLDKNRCPKIREWIKDQLKGKMGKDYSFDELPVEYNTWLLFRQVVDVILLNDFLAYCMFAFTCCRIPQGLSMAVHVMRWVGGVTLILFNLWVKTEAHNVVKDYGWYWGDVFFQRGALVFDGVFELAPHPMYSVGYAGYYGLSLICGSYAVLFVSLAAHAAQFAFLALFENPHIERMYGQRKLIAQRTPLFPKTPSHQSRDPRVTDHGVTSTPDSDILVSEISFRNRHTRPEDIPSTPGATEGETATETEFETETEHDVTSPEATDFNGKVIPKLASTPKLRSKTSLSDGHYTPATRKKAVTQHDLLNKYFRRDAMLLHNIDLFRANDFMLVLLLGYSLAFALVPFSKMSNKGKLTLHTLHAFAWCTFHCFGLGRLLIAQSKSKFLVRHFLKNYSYDYHSDSSGKLKSRSNADGPIMDAFNNWKAVYNLSLCMTYATFLSVIWNTYSIPQDWTVGNVLLRHTLGVLLVALHIWATMESYEVLGVFGWFFGDFFMEEYPTHLDYTGIYRYLNNPELIGGAAWFGGALISGSRLVLSLAVMRYLSHWWFLSYVENPHMRKLYGDSLRKEAGFVKVMKSVASKNARLLESRAGKHAPEIKRVAKEVKGTFDKVFEETAEVVEEFLARSRPMLSEVVQDTKVLLQQSREKLVITRIASNITAYDRSKYQLSIIPSSSDGSLRFHLGEPISVKWQAPSKHSRRDWIGVYRVGANKSSLVTTISSMGMWVPVYDEEWDGDIPLGLDRPVTPLRESESGVVVFNGDALPWQTGRYEIRYHHDGKYNVMDIDGPFDVYVSNPGSLNFTSVRGCLMRIVPFCLDLDPSLIPLSCKSVFASAVNTTASSSEDQGESDPDDFTFWSERQAKRICSAIKQAFNEEYAPEVIVADANISAIANRILLSKEIGTT